MSESNRLLVAALAVFALVAAFWFMLLAPKREESSALSAKIDKVEAEVAEARQQADAAEEAKAGFAEDYEQLVLLGKAVPGDDDTASLLVQIDEIARNSDVQFLGLELQEGSGEAAAAPPPAAPVPPADPAAAGATTTATPAAPTEATAALLPIGATVGAAGLGVMPYSMSFSGGFFEMAEFIENLDSLVKTTNGNLAADGRLVTIDGFSLEPHDELGFPQLSATFAVTTYLVPPGQGVTAGATPAAPAATTAPPTTTVTTTP